jgi:hypothetical protein
MENKEEIIPQKHHIKDFDSEAIAHYLMCAATGGKFKNEDEFKFVQSLSLGVVEFAVTILKLEGEIEEKFKKLEEVKGLLKKVYLKKPTEETPV